MKEDDSDLTELNLRDQFRFVQLLEVVELEKDYAMIKWLERPSNVKGGQEAPREESLVVFCAWRCGIVRKSGSFYGNYTHFDATF